MNAKSKIESVKNKIQSQSKMEETKVLKFKDNSVYEGDLNDDGIPHGKGVMSKMN